MRLKFLLRLTVAVAAGALLCGPSAAAAAPESIQAVWVPRRVTFIYQGFTTHYSCEGLHDQLREMLSKLGARDLVIRPYGCTRLVGPEQAPGARVSMQVLVPVSTVHDGKAGRAIAAHWHNVVLLGPSAGLDAQSNCELIEQFKERFLPLFTARDIRYSSNCVPHQLTLGTHLSAEVLMPAAAPHRD